MRSSFGDKARLLHINDSINEIQAAVANKIFDEFVNNHILRLAVVKWLEIIGEASNHITEETKLKAGNLDWNKIIGMRNFVVHEYSGINYDVIWRTINTQLEELKNTVEELLKDFE